MNPASYCVEILYIIFVKKTLKRHNYNKTKTCTLKKAKRNYMKTKTLEKNNRKPDKQNTNNAQNQQQKLRKKQKKTNRMMKLCSGYLIISGMYLHSYVASENVVSFDR